MDGEGRPRREQAVDDSMDGGGRPRREQAVESNAWSELPKDRMRGSKNQQPQLN